MLLCQMFSGFSILFPKDNLLNTPTIVNIISIYRQPPNFYMKIYAGYKITEPTFASSS